MWTCNSLLVVLQAVEPLQFFDELGRGVVITLLDRQVRSKILLTTWRFMSYVLALPVHTVSVGVVGSHDKLHEARWAHMILSTY